MAYRRHLVRGRQASSFDGDGSKPVTLCTKTRINRDSPSWLERSWLPTANDRQKRKLRLCDQTISKRGCGACRHTCTRCAYIHCICTKQADGNDADYAGHARLHSDRSTPRCRSIQSSKQASTDGSVSYTHLRSPRDLSTSRMPSSA